MAGKTIAFDSGHLAERGTEVALYDYAHFNETLLGNRSLVLCPAAADLSCLDRFRMRFSVILYRDRTDLERALRDVDLYYRIDSGGRPAEPPPRPPRGKVAVHCVFTADEPHGDIYAAISPWVAGRRGSGNVPVVPHMVHLPDEPGDLREALGIPRSATVLGRHGGYDTFNIPQVRELAARAVQARPDLHLLFLNTRPFAEHPRILHLPRTADPVEKTRFINTCDGMLHARAEGETFGLAIGEFSIRNRPVIAWSGGHDRFHVEVLGAKGLFYADLEQLWARLLAFRPMPEGDWDAYSERFSPGPVMAAFAEVFLGERRAAVPAGAGRQ